VIDSYMKIGTLFGVDIIINKFLIGMVVLASFAGYFEDLTILFFIIFIHELCHTLAARIYGLKVREVELMPFGGVARIESILELNPGIEIFIASAGPVANLIMAMVIVFLNSYYGVLWINGRRFIEMNLMLAGVNLVPALPLDGGRMFRAILTGAVGYKKATAVTSNLGKIIAVLFIGWGVYGIYQGTFNPTVFAMAIFLLHAAVKERRMAPYIFLKDITYKKDSLKKEGSLPVRQMVVQKSVAVKDVIKKFYPNRYHMVVVLNEDLEVIGSVSESKILDALIEHGPNCKIAKLLKS
jgi:stage IV sporulation protein FB